MEQKLKQRICIEFCVKLQISATETFEMLNKAFPNDAPKRTTVFEWDYRFKAGKISIENDLRQGRPKFQRTDENLKKTPAKFIPRFLTNEQKLCRLATCEDMLEMIRTDPEWKDKTITGDETWFYGYDLKPSVNLPSGEVRGSDLKKRPEKWTNGDWILHHDNSRPHTAHLTRFLAKNGTQILPQPPYSPDIAPNDLFLFPKLKAVLKGRHFDTRDDIIEKPPLALKSIPKEAYKNCFDKWEKRWRCKPGLPRSCLDGTKTDHFLCRTFLYKEHQDRIGFELGGKREQHFGAPCEELYNAKRNYSRNLYLCEEATTLRGSYNSARKLQLCEEATTLRGSYNSARKLQLCEEATTLRGSYNSARKLRFKWKAIELHRNQQGQVNPSLVSQPNRHLHSFYILSIKTKENLHTLKLNLDSQVLKLAKYKSLNIADKFKITYNAVKEIDSMLVSINKLLDGIKQDISTSEECSIKLPKFQLPLFSGNFSEWLGFKEIFIKVIDQNRALANSQKLQYLVSALRGDAARLVRAFSISDENYSIAWQTLIHRYDNKRELAFRQIQKFLNLKFIKGDSDKALYEFLDMSNEGVQNLSTLGLERNTLVDLILIYIIQSKQDNSLKKDWELHIDVQGYPSYEELITFLEKYARSLANLRLRETSKTSPKPNKVYSHATSVSRPNLHAACTPCMLCKNPHLLAKCHLFQNKSLQERWRFVKENGLCYNCLRSNHLVYACKLTAVCGVCKLRHHTLLHAFSSESHDSNSLPGAIHAVESSNANRVDSSGRSNVNSSACLNWVIQTHSINHSSSSSQILLSTALIRVNDLYGNSCMARALVDTGSQRTLITDSLRKTLNLPVNYSDASMLADPTFDKPAPIDIIIGADIAPSLYTGQVRFQNERGPTACNSKLGWLLSGKIMAQQSDGSLNHSVLTFCATSIDNQLRKFWELDSIPPCTQPILTKEEMDCEQHFKTNVSRTTTGRYQVRLPFRVTPNFGNSRRVAFKRFLSLENKLLKSEQLYSRYKLFMKHYSSLNHMQIISAVDIPKSPSQVYYMPHHCVLKEESTTTNLRVVFDASACSDDSPSLNKALHIGPKLQTDIFDLLLRFQTFFVALSADIEKMYRQILIHPDDSDYQRVLWCDSPSDAIQEYKLTTITYGTACAPYLAIRTLHQLADDEAMNYPVASEIMKRDFYVDDLLTGADTVEEAQVLIRQIIALLAEGGFPIRKWVSNSPKILDFLPKDQKGINQSFDFKDLPSVKLLGILWDPSLDSFTIRVKPPDIQVNSKRSLLSLIARIYDPLGWMAPLVIIFKIMLQKLWAKGCNWDERLPECIQRQWTGIEGDINQLNKISIPRYIPCRNSFLTLELHGFCDSSEKAYAAVIYVKSCKHDGSIDISLIASKTKVAPIKALSLPRLELCSALLLANLFVAVKESLSLHFDQIFLWSDSTIALNWIKSESKRWKTFVANRVSTIQRKTPPHSWFHVPGSENPADLATRGLTPAQLVDNQLWWQGPHWLQDPSVNSYIDLPPSDELSPETLIEERSTISVYHSIMGPMPELLLKYSSWIRTVDVMAFCLRFISNCKSTNKSLNRFLSASEIHNATVKIIILIQNQDFIQDIGWLRNKGSVSGKSNLRFLNPFLDADGILRVGGRLQHSNLDYNRKHPIILPKRHHCTDLIIEHYHKQSLHSGLQTTLSMISQKYWIISCKAAVKRVLNRCITCFKHRSKTVTQIMGELPLERVVPSRPFQRVGVDLAGPIITKPMLKRSKILFKTYIVLFICFTTKAIHLEVVSDLTAEAFIATLRRFTSRRGLPSDIFSDNASNFKLANRVLLDFYRELDIQNFCAQRGIRWHFIPPSAPHFGGLWEAGIKSVKSHLIKVTKSAILNFEEFYTLLTQIEAILNSRPLLPLDSNFDSYEALTPSHFLIGSPILAILDEVVDDLSHISRWKCIQSMKNSFWKKWSQDYLNLLQARPRWHRTHQDLQSGQLVLMKQDSTPPHHWPLARIIKTYKGPDGHVRVVDLKTPKNVLKRPITKIDPLPFKE
ncbi:hypothetical protein LAZ67_22001474 [Cordylochernes scorpioides]|uniref:Integrase catalytic domain-containing protein n=1 Tax=Cordylochernes scorpioides TaxID=51811 RepID=A0ABY6LP20_9ARAC|nr:hypothetical protein LAZ67_22001474 [Cordylochernes scorpioides]